MTKKEKEKTVGSKERLIRLNEVLKRLPIAKSTWWEGVKNGKYPQPVKLGKRITCWRLEEVLELVELGTQIDP